MSIERIGTADASTTSSPLTGSFKEHMVEIFPVIRKPPAKQIYLMNMTSIQETS